MLPSLLIDTLRLGSSSGDDLAARWRAVDIRGLLEIVAYEGAAIWLYRRLRAVGALDGLPSGISDRLRQMAIEAAGSRLEVEAEAAAAVTVLQRAAVPVILIKGVARCALAERYPYLDARATLDVDLLVPYELSAAAESGLIADGYVPACEARPPEAPRHHHLLPLHKGRITVELHDSTSVRVPAHIAWSRANEGSELVRWAGQTVRIPSVTEVAWSAVAHAMEDAVDGFRLARFLEFAALAGNDAPIDWAVLAGRRNSPEVFDPEAGVTDPALVINNWLGATLALVAEEHRPAGLDVPRFNLAELIAWRLDVLRARQTLGRPLTERLLTEGVRTAVGLPLELAPSMASRWAKMRRPVAGTASRAAFRMWRATRRYR